MITLINISTGYSRDKPLLKKFNYEFQNKIYGILGESGCGKTTFLRTVAGLMKPIEGSIKVDGKELQKASKNDIYMMHQNYTCFDWMNCSENILIAKRIKRKINDSDYAKAENMLKKVGLLEHKNKFPQQLSGGQRQRLSLARMLFVEPQIVLMDEPLSALDEKTRSDMQQLIIEMHKRKNNTIIMVTHSKEEAEKMCDLIINFK
mgnify:FL=1